MNNYDFLLKLQNEKSEYYWLFTIDENEDNEAEKNGYIFYTTNPTTLNKFWAKLIV